MSVVESVAGALKKVGALARGRSMSAAEERAFFERKIADYTACAPRLASQRATWRQRFDGWAGRRNALKRLERVLGEGRAELVRIAALIGRYQEAVVVPERDRPGAAPEGSAAAFEAACVAIQKDLAEGTDAASATARVLEEHEELGLRAAALFQVLEQLERERDGCIAAWRETERLYEHHATLVHQAALRCGEIHARALTLLNRHRAARSLPAVKTTTDLAAAENEPIAAA